MKANKQQIEEWGGGKSTLSKSPSYRLGVAGSLNQIMVLHKIVL